LSAAVDQEKGGWAITYVIAAPCIADYSCTQICPVDCISPGPQDSAFDTTEQLYINPATCISCGACKDVCPVEAIYESSELPAQWSHYQWVNREYFDIGAGR
jgi:ferredoxin